MPPTRITLVPHTHWDREWYEPFEVFRAHLCDMIDEAVDNLNDNAELRFTLDGYTALIDDYLEMRPDAEPALKKLVKAGKLFVGPWYTQADTLLADGESLIRNLCWGMKRGNELGGAMRLGYMPDQFGHAAQLPQIFRMFGIGSAVIWRGVGPDRPPHAFSWVSPNGSEVTAVWLQDGYGSGRRFPSDPAGFADAVERTLERIGDWIGEMPVLIPVGDDHVKLAHWLPAAAAALRARKLNVDVTIGGYPDHLPHMGKISHVVHGELRSPAFSPVLAGVASARNREKLACAKATNLLEHYTEPLLAWAALTAGHDKAARLQPLVDRAWKQLLLNHAHDSSAGCGVDLAHFDVKARYRWAEQLAQTVFEKALTLVQVPGKADLVAFTPAGSHDTFTIEASVPRSVDATWVAVGADNIARPVQLLALSEEEQPPVFEGEFSAAELGQYLGGLDPATPLFGKYLSGIAARDLGGGLTRLDVGLGEYPVAAAKLAEEQRLVEPLLKTAERFKVVLHAGAMERPIVVQAGPNAEAALVGIELRPGATGDAAFVGATARQEPTPMIAAGPLSVEAQPDGTVLLRHAAWNHGPVTANDLVDEGDRGDLYHFEPVAAPIHPARATTTILESGPIRSRMRIVSELDIPDGLSADRRERGVVTRKTIVTTEITLTAGDPLVEFSTTFDNMVTDHRLRAITHAPFFAEFLDVEHGLHIARRPFDTATALGAGTERAAPTGQHHDFADLSDGHVGVALISPGLLEHEVGRDEAGTRLALTLLRSVGWLSRGDLAVIDHAAGPMVATPDAQEIGAHAMRYALCLHEGAWQKGNVLSHAHRFNAPAVLVKTPGAGKVPSGRALLANDCAQVSVSAMYPVKNGLIVRLVNYGDTACKANLEPGFEWSEAIEIDPLEKPIEKAAVIKGGRSLAIALGGNEIKTLLVKI